MIYDITTNSFKYYDNESGPEQFISSNFVSHVLVLSSGIKWVGTYGAGLLKYSPFEPGFRSVSQDANRSRGLQNNLVFSILEDRNSSVWIGTHGGGLNKLTKDINTNEIHSQVYRAGEIPSDVVICSAADMDGNIWIGTREGIVYFNQQSKEFQSPIGITGQVDNLSDKFIWEIFCDSEGQIWVGTWDGLFFLIKRNKALFK
ncbi:MAG: ligand-binding sensor domain-containing protein [Saprospiraceae bacterium]|jgi:ligand-binding sensor domain-containing protein